MSAVTRSVVQMAAEAYARGDYETALSLYTQAGEIIGKHNVHANIILCSRKLKSFHGQSKQDFRAMIKDDELHHLDEAPPAELSKQAEEQFDLVFPQNIRESSRLLLRAFQLDPCLIRGRQLASKGISRGLLSAPASIYSTLLGKFSCSPQETQRMHRIINLEKLRRQPLRLPPVAARRAYTPDPKVSLFFFYTCLPHNSTGYAMRTQSIALELLHGSRQPLFYSRPGFPYDIKTSLPITEYSTVNNVTYHHLHGNNIFKEELETTLEKAAATIEAVARKHRAAVLHATNNYVNALPVLMAARRLGIPFVYEMRGVWELTRASKMSHDWTQTESYELDVHYETLVAQAADAVLPITQSLKEELISRGVSKTKITVVPNGVNPSEFRPVPPARHLAAQLGLRPVPTIGFIGSFSPYEGLEDLITAARQLKDQGADFNLLLVGDGESLDALKTQSASLHMNDRVFFTGRIPHTDVPAYYSLIDIAPFPRKPFKVCELVSPLKPFEAMAMGKVILVSNVNAMTEFLEEGVNGFSFRKGSVAHLTKQLGMLLAAPDLCTKTGESARRWVKEHRTWMQSVQLIEDIHDSFGYEGHYE